MRFSNNNLMPGNNRVSLRPVHTKTSPTCRRVLVQCCCFFATEEGSEQPKASAFCSLQPGLLHESVQLALARQKAKEQELFLGSRLLVSNQPCGRVDRELPLVSDSRLDCTKGNGRCCGDILSRFVVAVVKFVAVKASSIRKDPQKPTFRLQAAHSKSVKIFYFQQVSKSCLPWFGTRFPT